MASLPDFPPFNVHEDANAGPRWKKWLTRFERLLCGLNITADKRKTALLLHYTLVLMLMISTILYPLAATKTTRPL